MGAGAVDEVAYTLADDPCDMPTAMVVEKLEVAMII